jgi:hypothetical protein
VNSAQDRAIMAVGLHDVGQSGAASTGRVGEHRRAPGSSCGRS